MRSREDAAGPSRFVAGREQVRYVNPELQRLRALVDAARARLAELERPAPLHPAARLGGARRWLAAPAASGPT